MGLEQKMSRPPHTSNIDNSGREWMKKSQLAKSCLLSVARSSDNESNFVVILRFSMHKSKQIFTLCFSVFHQKNYVSLCLSPVAWRSFIVRLVWIVTNVPTFDSISLTLLSRFIYERKSSFFCVYSWRCCFFVMLTMVMANMNSCCNCRLWYRQPYKSECWKKARWRQ